MARESRSSHFLEHSEFYRALSELSSAIQKVHHYASEQLNLTLIGVHHDLKPQNIFVHAGTFILADFGLSKFKQIDQSSKSLFEIGEGHYLAPECEDYEDDFKKHTISRPSDIWSFGCILAEMLTYMFRGVAGVAEFKRSREIKIGSWKTYTFHAGRDKRNPGVIVWLKGLDSEITETGRMLLRLINSMLSMNPEARPTADRVTSSLRYIALDAYSRSIEGQYELLLKEAASTELDIESQRFRSWLWAVRSYENNDDPWNSRIYSLFDSSSVLKTLVQVRDELRSIRSRYDDAASPLFVDLCLLNDRLMALLPWEIQERAKTNFELQMIQTEDITLLAERQVTSGESSLHRKIAMLATMKRMNLLVSKRTETCRSDLHLELKSMKILERFEDHSLGLFKDPSGTAPRRVLIEWVRYDTHWEGRVSEEMYARMEAIAELLHSSSSKPNDLRVLTCAGFFHDPPRFSFGFVYDFPSDVSSSSNSTMIPRSLAEIIEGTKNSRNRPSLDDRFNLAGAITSSLLEFHKVGWMHKSISAYNILFLTTSDTPTQDWLKNPYIVGFNRSRPDQPLAFTQGPDTDLKSQSYQHAQYAENKSRFRVGFDYYSLGLVLLEIGLWQTLKELVTKMGASATLPSEETREKLLTKRVPLLNHAMGSGYSRATHACMTWIGSGHDNPDADEEKAASLLAFERLVVEPIGKCSV
jgi:serine/threonine protein kinase